MKTFWTSFLLAISDLLYIERRTATNFLQFQWAIYMPSSSPSPPAFGHDGWGPCEEGREQESNPELCSSGVCLNGRVDGFDAICGNSKNQYILSRANGCQSDRAMTFAQVWTRCEMIGNVFWTTDFGDCPSDLELLVRAMGITPTRVDASADVLDNFCSPQVVPVPVERRVLYGKTFAFAACAEPCHADASVLAKAAGATVVEIPASGEGAFRSAVARVIGCAKCSESLDYAGDIYGSALIRESITMGRAPSILEKYRIKAAALQPFQPVVMEISDIKQSVTSWQGEETGLEIGGYGEPGAEFVAQTHERNGQRYVTFHTGSGLALSASKDFTKVVAAPFDSLSYKNSFIVEEISGRLDLCRRHVSLSIHSPRGTKKYVSTSERGSKRPRLSLEAKDDMTSFFLRDPRD